MRLTLKFTLLLTAALLLALLLQSYSMLQQGRKLSQDLTEIGAQVLTQASEAQQQQRASLLADFLAPTLVGPVYYSDFDGARKLIETALKQPDVQYVVVFDAKGKLLHDGSIALERYGQLMQDEGATQAMQARERVVQKLGERIEIVTPLWIGADYIGGFRVGLSLANARGLVNAENQRLREAGQHNLTMRTLKTLPVLLLLAAIAMLLAFGVARGLVAPIEKLKRYARALQSGDYQSRLASTRKDEIGDVMRSFDAMAEAVRHHHEEIGVLAYSDSLTGLPNRNRVKIILQQHLSQIGAGQMAIILCDLDDFKRINDSLGHDAGDLLITELSLRFKRWIDEQAIAAGAEFELARFGGDEFVILVKGTQARPVAERYAQHLLSGCAQGVQLGERQVFITLSIGVAFYPDDGNTVDTLLKNADVAMYQAKMAGKNTLRLFAPAMVEAVSNRLNLEGELRNAIARGQLQMHYQPLVDINSRRIIGAEALMRWTHPDLGEVSPSLFIPLAEDTDLIASLGEWALNQACKQLRSWDAQLPSGFYLTVNVSVRQLRRQDMGAVVGAVLAAFPMAGKYLHLEITESSLFESSVHAHGVLERLKNLGIGLWLDDFGTGFSGLSQLRRLPVQGVKIDKSFISEMAHDPEDLAITQAIIAMAGSLGMKVTAEGVETEQQLNLLRERRCDTAQGYLFSKAVPADAFLKLLLADLQLQRVAIQHV
jgi:diguanylate cyclase (GGDEF)-like protein